MIGLKIAAAIFGIGVVISFLATNVGQELVSELLLALVA